MGKHRYFPYSLLLRKFRVDGNQTNVNSIFISMLEVALGFMKKYILMNGDHQTDTWFGLWIWSSNVI